MSCHDHLYRNMHPKQVTRRWFFEQCGVGLGSVALAQLSPRAATRLTIGCRPRRRTSLPRPGT